MGLSAIWAAGKLYIVSPHPDLLLIPIKIIGGSKSLLKKKLNMFLR